MQVNPYLNFDGCCEEAFRFYEKILGGKIEEIHTFESSPMASHTPPGWLKKVMHIRMKLGETYLMGSDAPPPRFFKPAGFSVSLQLEKPAEAERIYHALVEKGSAHMPIQETFWAARFAMLVDQYGIPWMINCAHAR
jgi:PhnB protein